MRSASRLAAFTAVLNMVVGAHAGVLEVDQPLASATFQIEYHAPVAQSFSVVGDRIEAIAVLAVNMNAFGDYLLDHDITLRLRDGIGVGGPVRASVIVDAARVIGGAGNAWVSFDFAALPAVPAGQYTFELAVASPRFGVAAQQDDPYAGGRAFLTDGHSGEEFGTVYDLAFKVSTVAEPSTALFLVAGLAMILARRFHNRLA